MTDVRLVSDGAYVQFVKNKGNLEQNLKTQLKASA
jgi:hypothetical protein